MIDSEFSLISKYFSAKSAGRNDVELGIGDDCALLKAPDGMHLASTMDTLVSGVHFPESTDPYSIGYKSLAVNLSDLAAMGAEPAWASLALTLPEADESWLQKFSEGFFSLLNRYGMTLIGGDTTKGPLSVTVHVIGLLPVDKGLRRDRAKSGDDVYISGHVGDAGLGLRVLTGNLEVITESLQQQLLQRLNRPEPRVELGVALRDFANAAIDVSDGVAADLGHILESSQRGARIQLELLPLSQAAKAYVEHGTDVIDIALSAGDDYELLFTAASTHRTEISKIAEKLSIPVTRIGKILQKNDLEILHFDRLRTYSVAGFDHFRKS